MPMLPGSLVGGKSRDNHVRPELANDAHYVGQHILLSPEFERLAVVLGISKIPGSREELLTAIHAPGREQFLGADYAQFIADFGTKDILPAVSASHGKIAGAAKAVSGQKGDQAGIFVIRMRRNEKDAAHLPKTPQLRQDAGRRVRCGYCHQRKQEAGEDGKTSYPRYYITRATACVKRHVSGSHVRIRAKWY